MIENAPDFAMLLMDPKARSSDLERGRGAPVGMVGVGGCRQKRSDHLSARKAATQQMQQEMERAAEFGRAADECWHVRKAARDSGAAAC